jgi:heat-inducible transcriptional repressor
MAQPSSQSLISELNQRSREIFRHIVDAYVETGEPVGSRTLARRLGQTLSPATIRNVMADLEEAGLLVAPHTSAGRLPTEAGLRLFVDGLLEIGDLSEEERRSIESQCAASGRSFQQVLDQATETLSGLARSAALVVAPKTERPLKHIEFVPLGPGRALVVLVTEDGLVENRVIDVPLGLPPSTLVTATNFLNAKLVGKTLEEAKQALAAEIEASRAELDELSAKIIEAGIGSWTGDKYSGGALILRGQSKLLEDVTAIADLERLRALFEALETKESLVRLLEATRHGEGVQIFIGSENPLFGIAGWSMIVAPYGNQQEQVVGAIGVIGPARLNYARIIPMVDYTAKLIGRVLG